jgi:hypothetical protein
MLLIKYMYSVYANVYLQIFGYTGSLALSNKGAHKKILKGETTF